MSRPRLLHAGSAAQRCRVDLLKTRLAAAIASEKAWGLVAPLPTWKDTPRRAMPSLFAACMRP